MKRNLLHSDIFFLLKFEAAHGSLQIKLIIHRNIFLSDSWSLGGGLFLIGTYKVLREGVKYILFLRCQNCVLHLTESILFVCFNYTIKDYLCTKLFINKDEDVH